MDPDMVAALPRHPDWRFDGSGAEDGENAIAAAEYPGRVLVNLLLPLSQAGSDAAPKLFLAANVAGIDNDDSTFIRLTWGEVCRWLARSPLDVIAEYVDTAAFLMADADVGAEWDRRCDAREAELKSWLRGTGRLKES